MTLDSCIMLESVGVTNSAMSGNKKPRAQHFQEHTRQAKLLGLATPTRPKSWVRQRSPQYRSGNALPDTCVVWVQQAPELVIYGSGVGQTHMLSGFDRRQNEQDMGLANTRPNAPGVWHTTKHTCDWVWLTSNATQSLTQCQAHPWLGLANTGRSVPVALHIVKPNRGWVWLSLDLACLGLAHY
jgi:hypothetical protein